MAILPAALEVGINRGSRTIPGLPIDRPSIGATIVYLDVISSQRILSVYGKLFSNKAFVI